MEIEICIFGRKSGKGGLVEIASEVADGPYSVMLEQVANGVAVRMAVLYLLAGNPDEM